MPLPTKIKDLIPALELIPHPEGGFFVETWRSGCEPMATRGQTGGLDGDAPTASLVVAGGRAKNRPDGDERRNCLTSIFWVPTVKSPRLLLARNCSDHVHYYNGGRPFRYSLYDPYTGEFTQTTLGPELHEGQKLQVGVKGGTWKCGRILDAGGEEGGAADCEYSLIGEAVAPGFDFHDFNWVTEELVRTTFKGNEKLMNHFLPFVHERSAEIQGEEKTVDDAAEFYENGAKKERRVEERS